MVLKLLQQLTGFKFTPEYRFHEIRKWRFDYAHVESKTAIEIEGGAFTNGRHTRGKGFIDDMVKYNKAVLLGWAVLRFTPSDMKIRENYELIQEVIENRLKNDKNI